MDTKINEKSNHKQNKSDGIDKDLDLINQIFAPNELNDSEDN